MAQYIILIISYLVPVVSLLADLWPPCAPTGLRVAAAEQCYEIRLTADAKEKETRALWQKEADEIGTRIKASGLSEADVEKLTAQQKTAPGPGEAAGQ